MPSDEHPSATLDLDPCADLDLKTPVDPAAPMDERDIALVQKTWARAVRLGEETVGKVLFMQVLKIAPEAIALFPQLNDVPKERLYSVGSPLVAYGAKIVSTLTEGIGMLTDVPSLVPFLKSALPDLIPAATKEHYGVIGQAALTSLEFALSHYWTEPVKNAWLKIWTTIVSIVFPDEGKSVKSVIKEGDPLPSGKFIFRGFPPEKIDLKEYVGKRSILMLAFPGAFTPV